LNRYKIISFLLFLAIANICVAQADTVKVEVVRMEKIDTINAVVVSDIDSSVSYALQGKLVSLIANNGELHLDPATHRKRSLLVAGAHVGIYAGSMLVLNQAWYAGYPRSSFHFFDDNSEWLQVDKVGHTWSAYQISRTSMETWKWAGMSRNQQIWLGGLSGAAFQTVIEVLDGFSTEWGWSWGDIGANFVGSGLLIGQQLGWGEQRISFKWGFHKMNYKEAELNQRTDQLHGKSLQERALKDYNGQTYWLSANLKSFFKKSNLPPWLNVSVGYGADGMFGAFDNTWTDKNNVFHDRSDIDRVRQFYLAPDIDFTRIRTKSKFLKGVFFVLNAFKMPTPALVFSKGKLGVKGFYF
jgi:uncharacterized protein YfiM (DUF2279 family)